MPDVCLVSACKGHIHTHTQIPLFERLRLVHFDSLLVVIPRLVQVKAEIFPRAPEQNGVLVPGA